jgi:hypothetical protein
VNVAPSASPLHLDRASFLARNALVEVTGVPCLLAVFALATPRLVIALLWFFTNWFQGLFTNLLWPILGFIFLPTTLLWYTAVQHWFGGQWTLWPIVGIVIALMIDISPASHRRERRVRDA